MRRVDRFTVAGDAALSWPVAARAGGGGVVVGGRRRGVWRRGWVGGCLFPAGGCRLLIGLGF